MTNVPVGTPLKLALVASFGSGDEDCGRGGHEPGEARGTRRDSPLAKCYKRLFPGRGHEVRNRGLRIHSQCPREAIVMSTGQSTPCDGAR